MTPIRELAGELSEMSDDTLCNLITDCYKSLAEMRGEKKQITYHIDALLAMEDGGLANTKLIGELGLKKIALEDNIKRTTGLLYLLRREKQLRGLKNGHHQ